VYGCVAGMAVVFDASVMSRQESIPPLLVWPAEDAPAAAVEEIDIPVVDLAEFLRSGEPQRGLAEACERHGFFHVVGHGVAPALLAEAYRCMDAFYARPLAEKQRAQRSAAPARPTATPAASRAGSTASCSGRRRSPSTAPAASPAPSPTTTSASSTWSTVTWGTCPLFFPT
jgi:hypothetical protein